MRSLRFICSVLFLSAGATFAQDSKDNEETSASSDYSSDDYILQPLDLLQIRVFQEPEMDRDVRMSREAYVALPLIGRVDLNGKTIRQAEALVRDLYDRDYLVNPQINITVLEYARRTMNVLGSVGSPGEVTFPREEGLNLLEAIARAGGFTRLAERRKVRLTRQTSDGGVVNYIIDADDMIDGDSAEQWKLETGDLIYVPERFL